jgi:Fungal specific transcription factor domain
MRRGQDQQAKASGRLVSPPLNEPIVDVAWTYFHNSFLPRSYFDDLPNMFDEFSMSNCFKASTRAAALANLARERKDGQLMQVSRKLYVKAVREVNAALDSPQEVSRDSTLVATLILGLFEALTLNDPQKHSVRSCIDNWHAHTNGTMSLIRFRGMELLQTDLGRRIYYQVANKVRANHTRLGTRLSPEFVELDALVAPELLGLEPVVRFWPVVDMTIELKAREKGQSVEKVGVFWWTVC